VSPFSLFTLLAAASFAPCVLAQAYPAKPVTLVVGYVAGGSPDLVARTLGQSLSQSLGQAFVVENRPGASATLAAASVAKAPADGYRLFVADTAPLVIAPFTIKGIPYDTLKDFTPVSLVYVATGMALVSNSGTSIKSLQDLLREAKAKPGKLSYGSSGVASIHHLAMEVFKAGTGTDMTHIPYKGSAQSVVGVLSGEIPVLYTALSTVQSHIASGKVNLLAVGSPSRQPGYPDVPAINEVVKDFEYTGEFGILGPAGLPAEAVARLSAGLKQAASAPDVVEKFKATGGAAAFTTPEQYAQLIRRNLVKFERAVKLAKIDPS
jgi:tripartite-type tricarboxylate transporter receptor subunit TctC